MEKAVVMAICNQKGGVGKTTSTINLGIGLAREGYRVLLIDGDAQGSLTQALGFDAPDYLEETLSDIMRMSMNDQVIPEGFGILQHDEGVDLMPSNIELSGVETSLINVISRESVLKRYVDSIKKEYDFILIDCMPSLGMMTINSLTAADSVLIPAQPHFLSAKGLEMLLQTTAKVKHQINPSLRIEGILMTMVNQRTNFSKDIIAILRGQYGERIRVFDTVIPNSIRVVEASAEGKSIYQYDPKGKVAESYEKFTGEVISIEKQRIKNQIDFVR